MAGKRQAGKYQNKAYASERISNIEVKRTLKYLLYLIRNLSFNSLESLPAYFFGGLDPLNPSIIKIRTGQRDRANWYH